jgi:hypothetical protein
MKHFMIKYQFANGAPEAWHREIVRFIAALDNDPDLKGKISYRCMKNRDDSSYYHLAAAADEQAVKTLQSRDFFKHYTEKTREAAGGEVVVTPIELIAETASVT